MDRFFFVNRWVNSALCESRLLGVFFSFMKRTVQMATLQQQGHSVLINTGVSANSKPPPRLPT